MGREIGKRLGASTATGAAAVATAYVFAGLWLAAPASASCPSFHGDPAPGYSGSVQGIFCTYAVGPSHTWTAPSNVSEATFSVRGADDASGAGGGHVEALLSLVPGETLAIELGAEGEASTVSRGGTHLFVGGGGNGSVPNYVTPEASEVTSEAPGGPFRFSFRNDGEVSIEWGEITKDPDPMCTVPRLRGMRPVAARKRLAEAHCAVGKIARLRARPLNRGRVIGQSPPPGTVMPDDLGVSLRVGRGPFGR